MSTRRGFLGSVIGVLVASKLDFIAEAPYQKVWGNTVYDRLDRMLTLNNFDLMNFRAVIHTQQGGNIWAPGMKAVNNGEFTYADLLATTSFSVNSCSLIDDEGFLISTGKFHSWYDLINGDILQVKHNISPFPDMPLKELIKKLLKQPSFDLLSETITPSTKAIRMI